MRTFTRAKTPRTQSSECFSFAAFAPLREIFRFSVYGSAALGKIVPAHSSTATKRHGEAPPFFMSSGRMIIFTRFFEI